MMNRLGGRKLLGLLLMLAVGIAIELTAEGGLSSNMMSLMMALYGAYVTGNIATKKFSPKGAESQSEKEPTEQVEVVEADAQADVEEPEDELVSLDVEYVTESDLQDTVEEFNVITNQIVEAISSLSKETQANKNRIVRLTEAISGQQGELP